MSYIDIGFDKTLYRITPNQLSGSAPLSSGSGIADSSASSIYNPITDSTPAESIASGTMSDVMGYGKKSFTDTVAGYRIGLDSTDKLFKWIIGGTSGSVDWNVTAANTLTITGALSATSGTIGGWAIGATTLTGGNAILDSTGNLTLGTGNDIFRASADNATYRSWIGNIDPTLASYSVTKAGAVTMSNVTITGGTVATSTLNVALQGWTTDIVFSSASATQINWTSGHIRVQNGTTWNISSGNTGVMSALTYIYFDTAVSVTALQTTTTYSTATGDGKILIATAQNNTVGASVIPMGGSQPIIDGTAQISALSITAASIAASTITASNLSVTTLSSITANMGTLTSGKITVVGGGNTVLVDPTQTNWLAAGPTGAPTFLVTDTGVLTATGAIINGSNITNQNVFGDGSDGAVIISADTTLTRDMFYDTLVVNTTKVLTTAGYRIFCKTSCTVTGTIDNSGFAGNTGSNGNNGGGGGSGQGGGAGGLGAILAAGKNGTSGGQGGGGGANGGNGGNGAQGSGGVALTAGGLIGAGVSSGNSGGGGNGGDGGGRTGGSLAGGAPGGAFTAAISLPRATPMITIFGYFLATGTFVPFSSSSSGGAGSGGGGGANGGSGIGGGGGGGGGSGGVGGIVMIAAKTLTVNVGGIIQSNGGHGGNGGKGGNGTVTGSGGGGGGSGAAGGNGGIVALIYSSYTNVGTVQTLGGAKGTGGAKGLKAAGAPDGSDGVIGNDGNDGTAGQVITIQI